MAHLKGFGLLELVLIAVAGLAFIWLFRFFLVGRGLPYAMSRVEQIQLGGSLTRLSNLFEALEREHAISMQLELPDLTRLDVSQLSRLEASLAQIDKYNPEIVTYVLLGHMRTSMSLGNQPRAMGQSVLLEHLKGLGLAIPAERLEHSI
jgi:hypothetical protein